MRRRHGFHKLCIPESTTYSWDAHLVFNLSGLALCAQYPAVCLMPDRHPIVFVGLVHKYRGEESLRHYSDPCAGTHLLRSDQGPGEKGEKQKPQWTT